MLANTGYSFGGRAFEIQLEYGDFDDRTIKNVAVTMRTPGHDDDLSVGFLFTEGIIRDEKDVLAAIHIKTACSAQKQNIILLKLNKSCLPKLQHADRNFYTTSSCGVCGKSAISAIRTTSKFDQITSQLVPVDTNLLYKLPGLMTQAQNNFSATGGIHASGLFSAAGELLLLREDVGRHNALDKLIGCALMLGLLPLNKHILVLSGRASFELIQKAAMAGIRIVAAMGAPSSLAVEVAHEFDITLAGFLSNKRLNVYTSGYRIYNGSI